MPNWHLEELEHGPARDAYVALARLSLELARETGLEESSAAMLEALLAEES